MSHKELQIDALLNVNDSLLDGLNELLPDLSEKYVKEPLTKQALERVAASDSDFLVARFAGQIVGTATVSYFDTLERGEAWLSDMVVSSQHQGKGFGRGLLEVVYDCARNRGAERIGWTSHWSREAAHGLYAASGADLRETAVFMKKLQEA